MQIDAQRLTEAATEILARACADPDRAARVARRLVNANLVGHDSHGVGMIPRYVDGIAAKELDPKAHARVEQEKGPFLLVNGQRGFGHIVAEEAMEKAIAHAKTHHIAVLALKNAFHIGRIGDWGEMASDAGFISMHYVNVHSPTPHVAPFGGSDARFSTNPYCAAIPGGPDHPPVLLDMATSTIAHGKARVAHLSGKPAPDGSLIDNAGRPTRDPGVLFSETEPLGALTAFGAHKGSGLALLCDMLAGSFTGGGAFLPERIGPGRIVNNMLAVLIDPNVFGGAEAFHADIAAYADWVGASPNAPGSDGPMLPGTPERQAKAERAANGIPLDDGTWAQLCETAASLGLEQVEMSRLAGLD